MDKICAKPMCKCAVCGEVYDSIAQRMNCEQTCLKKRAEEERKAAEAKKAAEYEARVAEVDMAFDKAYDLQKKLEADFDKSYFYRDIRNLEDVFKYIFGV